MQISNSPQNQYCNFTARAPQIKDAEWVSHIVNSTFPHFSTTKHQPGFISFISQNQNFARKPKTLQDVLDRIELNQHIKKYNHKKNFSEQIKDFFYYLTLSTKQKKEFKIQQAIYNKIVQVIDLRRNCFKENTDTLIPKPIKMIGYIKNQKIANCMEDAILTNMVLKMNGVKNAARIHMYNLVNGKEKIIDHAVCIVNPPNLPLQKGKLNPKSIIVDSWSGKCDYADNMLTYYRNLKGKFFRVKKLKDVVYEPILEDGLTPDILAKIKQEYPQLIFPNKDRKFLDLK